MAQNDTPLTVTTVRLDELIAAIRATHDDPLEQLSGAVVAGQHLGEVADALIGHFVDQARRSGRSWTEIGSSMGVSKQAAQKRFVSRGENDLGSSSNPFAHFTPRAQNVIAAAHNTARAARAQTLTPAFIARGLATETESLAALAVRAQNVDIATFGRSFTENDGSGTADSPDDRGLIPFDDAAKSVLEATVRIAVDLGHGFVGTEHILLGLFTDPSTAAALADLGLDEAATRTFVVDTLAQAQPDPRV